MFCGSLALLSRKPHPSEGLSVGWVVGWPTHPFEKRFWTDVLSQSIRCYKRVPGGPAKLTVVSRRKSYEVKKSVFFLSTIQTGCESMHGRCSGKTVIDENKRSSMELYIRTERVSLRMISVFCTLASDIAFCRPHGVKENARRTSRGRAAEKRSIPILQSSHTPCPRM